VILLARAATMALVRRWILTRPAQHPLWAYGTVKLQAKGICVDPTFQGAVAPADPYLDRVTTTSVTPRPSWT
jgi:hypothetical protein